jgi:hypothetical protein
METEMKRIAMSALLAFAAMSSVALAEPAKLSDSQLDQVSAGWFFSNTVTQVNLSLIGQNGSATNVCALALCGAGAGNGAYVFQVNHN